MNFIQEWEEKQELPLLLEECNKLKLESIHNQNYERAAEYRSKEKEIIKKIEKYNLTSIIKDKIQKGEIEFKSILLLACMVT